MDLIERWHGGIRSKGFLQDLEAELTTAAANHYDADRNCRAISTVLGWGSIILAAIVASSLLKETHYIPTWASGILSIASAILGTAAKLKDPEIQERATKHREAGACYLGLRDRVSQLIAEQPPGEISSAVIGGPRVVEIIQKKKENTDGAPSLPYLIFYIPAWLRMVILVTIGLIVLRFITLWMIYLTCH